MSNRCSGRRQTAGRRTVPERAAAVRQMGSEDTMFIQTQRQYQSGTVTRGLTQNHSRAVARGLSANHSRALAGRG